MRAYMISVFALLVGCLTVPLQASDYETERQKRRDKADEIIERLGHLHECRSRIGDAKEYRNMWAGYSRLCIEARIIGNNVKGALQPRPRLHDTWRAPQCYN